MELPPGNGHRLYLAILPYSGKMFSEPLQSPKIGADYCLWTAKAKDGSNASICPESIAARGFIIIHLPEGPNDEKLITNNNIPLSGHFVNRKIEAQHL